MTTAQRMTFMDALSSTGIENAWTIAGEGYALTRAERAAERGLDEGFSRGERDFRRRRRRLRAATACACSRDASRNSRRGSSIASPRRFTWTRTTIRREARLRDDFSVERRLKRARSTPCFLCISPPTTSPTTR